MRRTQKILIGLFLSGVLMGGIGTGIAMVEYSSLTYGGEKLLGEEHLVTEDFDFSFDLDGPALFLCGGYGVDDEVLEHVVSDPSIPAGTVRYEITYNKEQLTPILHFEEEYEETESEITRKPGPSEETEGEVAEEKEEEGSRILGRLYLTAAYDQNYSDFKLVMENKDQFLEDLKQKKISSYDVAGITQVTVRANSETLPYLKTAAQYQEY